MFVWSPFPWEIWHKRSGGNALPTQKEPIVIDGNHENPENPAQRLSKKVAQKMISFVQCSYKFLQKSVIERFHRFCFIPSFNSELQKTPQLQGRQTCSINLLICANKEFSNMAGEEILLFEQRILANIFQCRSQKHEEEKNIHPNLVWNQPCLIFTKIVPLASLSMNNARAWSFSLKYWSEDILDTCQ